MKKKVPVHVALKWRGFRFVSLDAEKKAAIVNLMLKTSVST